MGEQMDFHVEITAEDEEVLRNLGDAYAKDYVAQDVPINMELVGWREPIDFTELHLVYNTKKLIGAGLIEHSPQRRQWRITQLGRDTLAALDKAKQPIKIDHLNQISVASGGNTNQYTVFNTNEAMYHIEHYDPFNHVWSIQTSHVGKDAAIQFAKTEATTRLVRVLDDQPTLIWPNLEEIAAHKRHLYLIGLSPVVSYSGDVPYQKLDTAFKTAMGHMIDAAVKQAETPEAFGKQLTETLPSTESILHTQIAALKKQLRDVENERDIRGVILDRLVGIRTELIDDTSNSWIDSIELIRKKIHQGMEDTVQVSQLEQTNTVLELEIERLTAKVDNLAEKNEEIKALNRTLLAERAQYLPEGDHR